MTWVEIIRVTVNLVHTSRVNRSRSVVHATAVQSSVPGRNLLAHHRQVRVFHLAHMDGRAEASTQHMYCTIELASRRPIGDIGRGGDVLIKEAGPRVLLRLRHAMASRTQVGW